MFEWFSFCHFVGGLVIGTILSFPAYQGYMFRKETKIRKRNRDV